MSVFWGDQARNGVSAADPRPVPTASPFVEGAPCRGLRAGEFRRLAGKKGQEPHVYFVRRTCGAVELMQAIGRSALLARFAAESREVCSGCRCGCSCVGDQAGRFG